MNYINENLTYLKANQSHLKGLQGITPEANLSFITARSGVVSAKLGKMYLHSQFDPWKEAEQLIHGKVQQNISGAIFFGFGLGYHIEVFIRSFPKLPILIFEPDTAVFLKVLESRSLVAILGNRQVRILLGKNINLIEEINHFPLACVQVIKLRSVYEKDAEFYTSLDNAIQSYLSKKEVNINTMHRFGKLWVKNLVKNMELLATMPGIVCLQDLFMDIPAIILASGPSLNEIWEILPALQQRLLVIVVDTSVKACLAQGVEPDFVIVVDPQYWNTRHLDWTYGLMQKAYLVSESSTHPRIFRTLPLRGFFASSFFPLGNFFEAAAGYKGKIGAGGSVATSAWDFARLAGCCPLYLAGLDLGFPAKQTHFKGAFFEERFHTLASRLEPAEKMAFAYLRQADPYWAEANNGEKVLTDRRMDIYRSWFETQTRIYPAATTYNLSPAGVKIPGLATAQPELLLQLPVIRDKITRKLEGLETFFQADHHKEIIGKLKAALQDLLADLLVLQTQAKKGLQQTAEIRRNLAGGKTPVKALELLDQVDKEIMGLSSRLIAGFLLQPVIHGIANTGAKQTHEETIAVSERIYRELRDSAAYHYELLNRALKHL